MFGQRVNLSCMIRQEGQRKPSLSHVWINGCDSLVRKRKRESWGCSSRFTAPWKSLSLSFLLHHQSKSSSLLSSLLLQVSYVMLQAIGRGADPDLEASGAPSRRYLVSSHALFIGRGLVSQDLDD